MPLISVITPSYNRAHLLIQVGESLARQTYKNFEWLIVDDGSTDETNCAIGYIKNLYKDFFPIIYISKENGGKHTAINRGVEHARGELTLILDSDDELPADALDIIIKNYDDICHDTSFGGVCGMMAHRNGERITQWDSHLGNCLAVNGLELRYKLRVTGDMCEVFRTEVLRKFPFPEIKGEKFCPEALVWNRIASKYKLRCFNQVTYYRDYLEGGLTDKIVKIRMESPRASMMTYQELTKYDIPFKDKLKAAVNYWRFRFCAKGDNTPSIDYKWYFAIPFGYLMHLKDIRTTKS
ncbi:MAG: glycosyltransferase family A protein [Prevotella sp.]|nr:glycosyltransferase family A protein [Prevotella sp.]